MASEKTLRRLESQLKSDPNVSDRDLLDRFTDINDKAELDQLKDSILKKKIQLLLRQR